MLYFSLFFFVFEYIIIAFFIYRILLAKHAYLFFAIVNAYYLSMYLFVRKNKRIGLKESKSIQQ